MRACIFTYSFEGLGTIEPWLVAQGYQVTYTRFYEQNASFPKLEEIDFDRDGWTDERQRRSGVPLACGRKSVDTFDDRVLQTCFRNLFGSAIDRECSTVRCILIVKKRSVGFRSYPLGTIPKEESLPFSHSLEVFHWHGETFDLPAMPFGLQRATRAHIRLFKSEKT